MSEEDLTTKPLVDIFKEMTYLEQEIGLTKIKHKRELDKMILKYEKLRLEIIKRFPLLEENENFQKKKEW